MQSGTAFDALLQHMPVGLIVWQLDDDDVTLRLLCANPAADALCGIELSTHVGRSMADLFPRVRGPREREYIEIARSGTPGVIIRLPDSHSPQITFSGRAMAMADRCVGVMFQDLAEQTAQLAKREERFRTLIQNSSDGIGLVDRECRPIFVSESVAHILGYSADEIVGRDSFPLLHPEDEPAMRALFARVLENPGKRFSIEVRLKHANGSFRWAEIINVNRLDDPNVGAIVDNFRDVTERRAMAEALRETEEQLLHAQKMEAIGRLAGGIAHDFNNLLSVVLSYADILLAKHTATDGHAELAEIRRAGANAAELTHQLLAFSRKQLLTPRVVNVSATLTAMSPMIQRVLGGEVTLQLLPAAELWDVRVDPNQLEQVVLNLVVNARDAMPNGGTLSIATTNVVLDESHGGGATPGPNVMLTVSDTGVGMDRSTQERIFEPFFTTKTHGKGTGLGLSTAFGIVSQSGGCIRVHSEVGLGTTFKVYLPRTSGTEAGVRGDSDAPPPARGHETILLVEDDAGVRSVTRRILENQGYTVLEAASGDEALRIGGAFEIVQLLLTDVVMPKMSGRELAERVLKTRPTLKVLFVSGYTDDTVVRHNVLDDGVAFLQKPITPSTLARKVRMVLDS